MHYDDTITALSTPPGEGGISIIRLSGPKSLGIALKLFVNKHKKPMEDIKERYLNYGYIIDKDKNIIDEVLMVYMKAPGTYTREDMIEIHCHGGMIPVSRILSLIMTMGARLAQPGEFTKRAFLNGRIDLSQAEAVMDLINAKTDAAARISVDQMQGSLSALIKDLRERLLDLIAHIEVTVDYPEEDIEEATVNEIRLNLKSIKSKCNVMLETADQGKIIREGIKVVIAGKPNVGKSSLLNMLLRENKAIVTDIPGTTRDIIEDYINIRGVLVHLIDTAGIRSTEDLVESIGVERSKDMLNTADLILMMLDASSGLDNEDKEIIKMLDRKKTLVILNKVDLPVQINQEEVKGYFKGCKIVNVSIKTGAGIEDIKNFIYDMAFEGKVTADMSVTIMNNRHKQALITADRYLSEAITGIDEGFPLDLVTIDIRNAWNALGEITGETVEENLIDRIFSNFCLGK